MTIGEYNRLKVNNFFMHWEYPDHILNDTTKFEYKMILKFHYIDMRRFVPILRRNQVGFNGDFTEFILKKKDTTPMNPINYA